VRQSVTEATLTNRTPEAHQAALATFRKYLHQGIYTPPSREGLIVRPGYDGGAEWGGPAFDPETGLLYVNANEMAWLLTMIPGDDKSLYQNNCASCHQRDLRGTPGQFPSLVDIARNC
jgi:quinoprotein glucose dehydrogenase